ncbi:MAG: hypothetical protein O2921_08540 [Chloroflexi bacterium]|nr:hypothetical protein [Chloroflexota bacterium]MDA1282652.1 hypothetical protein [Chloroflexota bacterium]
MLHQKPLSVDRTRMQYFQAVQAVNLAENGIERDRARSAQRKGMQMLQNSQRIQRGEKAARALAKSCRRVYWNLPDTY